MKSIFFILIALTIIGCQLDGNKKELIIDEEKAKQTFTERRITYNTHDGYLIEGIITSPEPANYNNLPGIILIHGSAPLDMDASWPAYLDSIPQTYNGKEVRNYKLIAEFLSEIGFTVIRVNKRGVKQSLIDVDFEIYKTTSYTNILKDVHSEIETLKRETNIEKFILIGWSEGTILSTKIAEERNDIVGMILMGVIGSSFKGLMCHFFENEEKFQEVINSIENMPDDEMVGIDRPAIRVKELFQDIPNAERIAKLELPILVLHGDIDVETPFSEAYLVKEAIEKSNNPKSKVIIYKGFGHGFAPHLGGKGEIKTIGPFDKIVINDIVNWLNKNFADLKN